MTSIPPRETLTFPPGPAALITPYLPPNNTNTTTTTSSSTRAYPYVTLTYAHSLDASISLGPGIRTALSGPESKAMTHFLRAHHDAILVGAGTAVADDPGLNSRLAAAVAADADGGGGGRVKQPRPVVLDPRGRWAVHAGSKVVELAREGSGLGPLVLVDTGTVMEEGRRRVLEAVGGRYIALEARGERGRFEWADVLSVLKQEGLGSVMIEGGGEVINSLLAPPGNAFVDSVIVTIAPTWLGQGGVVVSPVRSTGVDGQPVAPARLTDVTWCPLGEDVVLCGRILR
ncbi:dihydrofolate reductase-like domain-containing protein [Staphylotrichum tortipilum]|uniref:2,5-diamino-6-ribosylamino-4(3H)-pyrimidinone 5'-phosphate reductase n=1 Tax=Staphylotrichum tortipilum TaxID=2831512 RepID=A0AAN6MWI4_9PEZI|nr:dihydrofolate reductase-like domain-containing protein [Staphylotrichum longicolle]